jgi:hypothetical protein
MEALGALTATTNGSPFGHLAPIRLSAPFAAVLTRTGINKVHTKEKTNEQLVPNP